MESFMFAPVGLFRTRQANGITQVGPHRTQHSSLARPGQRCPSHVRHLPSGFPSFFHGRKVRSSWVNPKAELVMPHTADAIGGSRGALTLLCSSYYSARGTGAPSMLCK